MAEWLAEYEQALPAGEYAIALEEDRERHVFQLRASWRAHGIAESTVLGYDFFMSTEYEDLKEVAVMLRGLLEEGAYVMRGERRQPAASFPEALSWMLDEARRGVDHPALQGFGRDGPGAAVGDHHGPGHPPPHARDRQRRHRRRRACSLPSWASKSSRAASSLKRMHWRW